MAEGDRQAVRNVVIIEAIVGAVATDDGIGWFDVSGHSQAVIHVEGITTGTVQVRGSNQEARPGLTDDEVQVGSDITSNAMVAVTAMPRWMKVMVSAWTTGTFNVYVLLRP